MWRKTSLNVMAVLLFAVPAFADTQDGDRAATGQETPAAVETTVEPAARAQVDDARDAPSQPAAPVGLPNAGEDNETFVGAVLTFMVIMLGVPLLGWLLFSRMARRRGGLIGDDLEAEADVPLDPRNATGGIIRTTPMRAVALASRH